jgi:hypothetical protein
LGGLEGFLFLLSVGALVGALVYAVVTALSEDKQSAAEKEKLKAAEKTAMSRGTGSAQIEAPSNQPDGGQPQAQNMDALIRSRFWLSNIAIIFGILYVVAGLSGFTRPQGYTSNPGLMFAAGCYIILGGGAYRSLKRRKLALKKTYLSTQVLEVLAIVAIVLHVALMATLQRIAEDPVNAAVIPLWAVLPYLVLLITPSRST